MRLRIAILIGLFGAVVAPAAAQRLPVTVTPEHYDLAFVVDLGRERFDGTETIRVQVSQPTNRVVLNAVDLDLRDVTIGTGPTAQKATVTLDESKQTVTLSVPKPIANGTSEIRIRYSGTLNTQLRGFYISKTKQRKYAVTQFESTDARRAFPCFDEPAFKATFALSVTVDRGDIAISNGRVQSDTAGPSATQHTMRFATTPRMSTYLVAIAVGDFKCLDGSAEQTPIRVCATPDKRDLGAIALESAKDILRFYNGYYAVKYPFGKLDVVAVPDFAAGAMENTAAIFYRETDLLADSKAASVATRKKIMSILAHEMAHQWFGDLVTMQWWDDIWLNEGFATWMANKPLAAAHPEWNVDVDEEQETQKAMSLDALKATRPIHVDVEAPADIDEAFDAITYEKGASVLRMVESYVGAEAFRNGVNTYLQAHAYKNATSEDFWKALSASSGKPVERILPTFVNQPGVPLLDVALACANDQTTVTLKQQRLFADGVRADAARWQIPICVKAAGRDAPVCEVMSDETHTMTLGGGCAPWVFANAGARGYYRTGYSPELLRALAPHVAQLTAPERLSLEEDEWTLVRARRHSVAEYLTLTTGYAREHSSGVLEEIAHGFEYVRQYLASDASRPRFEAFVRTLLRPLFDELGFAATPNERDDRRTLRAATISMLGTIGNDPDVIARAKNATARALAGGPPLDATLADAVVQTAAMHGDAALFDALAAAADRTENPDEHFRYLYALPAFRDPALIDRALNLALTPQLRAQDAAIYLGQFFTNETARARALAFVTERWPALAPKVTIVGGDVNLVRAMGNFCDAGARQAIATFFAAHPLPGAARTLQQTLERIDTCVALRGSQSAAVDTWLAGR